jgi:hypothetical protein
MAKWEVKKDGETKYLTKISVDEVEFCGSKGDVESTKSTEKVSVFDAIDDTDDLPFD